MRRGALWAGLVAGSGCAAISKQPQPSSIGLHPFGGEHLRDGTRSAGGSRGLRLVGFKNHVNRHHLVQVKKGPQPGGRQKVTTVGNGTAGRLVGFENHVAAWQDGEKDADRGNAGTRHREKHCRPTGSIRVDRRQPFRGIGRPTPQQPPRTGKDDRHLGIADGESAQQCERRFVRRGYDGAGAEGAAVTLGIADGSESRHSQLPLTELASVPRNVPSTVPVTSASRIFIVT